MQNQFLTGTDSQIIPKEHCCLMSQWIRNCPIIYNMILVYERVGIPHEKIDDANLCQR
jgi:hypothetical protein